MNALDVFADARPDVDGLDRARFDAIADELFGTNTTPVPGETRATVTVVPAPVSRSRTRAGWLIVAAAAAVVVLVVGLVAVAGDRDAEAPATPPTELPAVPIEPLRLLPADPSAYEFDGQLFERRPLAEVGYVRLARPDGAGGYVDPVWVARADRDAIWAAEPDWEGDGTFSEFEFGDRTMEFVDDAVDGHRLVQFEVGDGTAVEVSAQVPGPAGTYRDELAAIGLALDLSDGGVRVDTPPDGYEVVATGRLGLVSEPTRSLSVWRGGKQFVALSTTVTSNQGFPFLEMGESIEPVTIRGRGGWITTSTWESDDGPWERSALIWEEQPGQWVKLEEMNPVTLDELGAFAASLVEVDADSYAAVVDEEGAPPLPGSEATVPTTALVTETSVAVPPPSTVPFTMAPQTAPAGTVLVVNGTRTLGIAGRTSRVLEESGVDVIGPTDATGGEFSSSVLYVRPGAEALGSWVTARFAGAHAVVPLAELDVTQVEGGIGDADVVLVLGLDAVPPASAPIVFGDDVMLNAAPELSDRGYVVNAEVSRQLEDMVPDVEAVVDAVRPTVVVVHLGTNGPFTRRDLDGLLAATADVPNVILVNAHADRPWVDANNTLIDEVDRSDDNLLVLDWHALADECPGECFASDGIHLVDAGAAYFAERLGELTGL